jgi:hypothetical protein
LICRLICRGRRCRCLGAATARIVERLQRGAEIAARFLDAAAARHCRAQGGARLFDGLFSRRDRIQRAAARCVGLRQDDRCCGAVGGHGGEGEEGQRGAGGEDSLGFLDQHEPLALLAVLKKRPGRRFRSPERLDSARRGRNSGSGMVQCA